MPLLSFRKGAGGQKCHSNSLSAKYVTEINDNSDGQLQLQNKQYAIRNDCMWRNSHKTSQKSKALIVVATNLIEF